MTLEKTLILPGLPPCYPIVAGGMGIRVSGPNLAGLVAYKEGVGTLSSASLDLIVSIEQNRKMDLVEATAFEVRKAKELANGNGAIAINIMMALQTSFLKSIEGAILGGVDIIVCGAGLPLSLPTQVKEIVKKLKEAGHLVKIPLLIPIVSSGRAAEIICKRWKSQKYIPDAIIVEGPKAGGHLGWNYKQVMEAGDDFLTKYDLINVLYPEVLEIAKIYGKDKNHPIPLILAGGFSKHEEIEDALKLFGVVAIQFGTVFLMTNESYASPEFKEAIRLSTKKDIILGSSEFGSPCGLPFRFTVLSRLYLEWLKRQKNSTNTKYSFCICTTLCGAVKVNLTSKLGTNDFPRGCPLGYVTWNGKCNAMGHPNYIPLFTCGTIGAEINKIVPVKELMKRLIG